MPRRRVRIVKEWRNPSPLLESEITALSTLANEGPTNVYQIKKKTGKAYSLMFNAVKELEKRRLVKLIEKKQTSRGTTANFYDLTLEGVLSVLEGELASGDRERFNYNLIHKIVKKYESLLPLIFGKWSYLQEVDLETVALFRLKAVVDNQDLFERGEPLIPAANKEQRICWFFYFFGLIPARPEFEGWGIMDDPKAWISAWTQDKDIRAFVSDELKRYQIRLKNLGAYVERLITLINGDNKHREALDGRGGRS